MLTVDVVVVFLKRIPAVLDCTGLTCFGKSEPCLSEQQLLTDQNPVDSMNTSLFIWHRAGHWLCGSTKRKLAGLIVCCALKIYQDLV